MADYHIDDSTQFAAITVSGKIVGTATRRRVLDRSFYEWTVTRPDGTLWFKARTTEGLHRLIRAKVR